jgi:uncharacterized LabA/DUF88 family protein
MVFIDYQNVYRAARASFGLEHQPHWKGQIDPLALGRRIVEQDRSDRELIGVRVYRGRPDATKEPKGYAANRKQSAAWTRQPQTVLITRTLRYPATWPNEPAEEKGIDVALAIDMVTMAVHGEYDVGILMSLDTDLKPALEAVCALRGRPYPRCEVAAWSALTGHSRRLSVVGQSLWCHWLDEAAYRAVADDTRYS